MIGEPLPMKKMTKAEKKELAARRFREPDTFRTFEKSISSYVQASLNLPKVNVMVLQASVVEEMCSFSALDRVKDITCVSLLSLGIKETRFQLCKTSQSKKTVQVYQQNQESMEIDKDHCSYDIDNVRQFVSICMFDLGNGGKVRISFYQGAQVE